VDKSQAIEDFFRNLKKTFNIASLFTKGHPSFAKTVVEFKNSLNTLLTFLSPVKVGITPESFLVEDTYFKGLAYQDLAKMLHLRRIKSFQITPGITEEELAVFFATLSLHPKEIIAGGGVGHLLKEQKSEHILIEELDYSQLLKGSGKECADIWIYLLKEAVEKDDPQNAGVLADNFEKMVQHFGIKDLLEDPESKENIYRFFSYLKNKGKDKLGHCAKQVARSMLQEKDIGQKVDPETIKMFLKDLSDADFADVLSDGLLTDDGFDPVSFTLFSRILDEDKQKSIAAETVKAVKARPFKDTQKVRKNIEKLFSTPGDTSVSQVYRATLSALLQDTAVERHITLDREQLQKSYQLVLLNLFYDERDPEKIPPIVDKLMRELDGILRKKDLEYLVFLMGAIHKKRKEDPLHSDLFDRLDKAMYDFIEHNMAEDEGAGEFKYFFDSLQKSSLGIDFYLHKIFNEEKINPVLLKLFFKFFPAGLPVFYTNIERKRGDIEFLEAMVEQLSIVDHPYAVEALKYIYSSMNNFIKMEVLKAMRKLPTFDREFLLSILKSGEPASKKEVLLVLMQDEGSRKQAVEVLFSIKSPWGTKNNIILENIIAVGEAGFKAAEGYLAAMSKKYFFWNSEIRKEALKVLKKWAR
jgi:hypothetical protein